MAHVLRKVASLAGFAAAIALARPCLAQQSALPARLQATVLARVLAYDNALVARAGETLVIGIVYLPRNGMSTAEADAVFESFKELERRRLHGLPLRIERIEYANAEKLLATVKDHGVDALYVSAGLEEQIAAIGRVAQAAQALTISASRQYTVAGLSVCATIVGNKPVLIVNRSAAVAEGARFGSDFLALTTVVD